MIDLSRLEWLMGQVTPLEAAARLRLKALERLCQPGEPRTPLELPTRAAFPDLSRREEVLQSVQATGAVSRITGEADSALDGNFTLFASFPYRAESGTPDWYAAFPSGPPWPAAYAFDIDISGRDGRDVRFTWELSRHRHLASLAQAWFVSEDKKYSQRLEALLADWIARNPFLVGPNWTSALEAAVRAIAWVFIDDAAGGAFLYTGFHGKFTRALYAHGLHVETFQSTGLNPSNHIIGEAAGLFILGTKFVRTVAGRRWRARAARILEREIIRQTFDSGASREQSTAYHRFVTDLFSLCVLAGGRESFSRRFLERLQLMRGFADSVTRPDGSVPALGDSDDASVVPSILSFLMRGNARTAAVDKLSGNRARSVLHPDAGLAVLRSADASCQIEFRCGPQGYSPVSSHGHADALSVTLWRGRDRLVDAGTYRYNGYDAWRNAFRSTHFHNAVVVDGQSQAVPASRFRWLTLANARPSGRFFAPEVDWVSGELPAGPSRAWTHRRDVIRVGSSVILILDTIEAAGEHTAAAYFHFGDARLSVEPSQARAQYDDGMATSLRAANPATTVAELNCASPVPAWQSRSYGVIEPSATIAASTPFSGRVILPWILSIGVDSAAALPPATNGALAVEFSEGDSRWVFVALPVPDVTHTGYVGFVGRWALVELRGGDFVKAFCAAPWALEYKGDRLFTRFGGVDFRIITR